VIIIFRNYEITTSIVDIIQDINLYFFDRKLEEEDIKARIKEKPESGIIYGVQRDKTLSLRMDLMEKLNKTPVRLRKEDKGDNKYDTTMRFRRDPDTGEAIIRIPPSHSRIPLFKDDIIIPENQTGYILLLPKFIVCQFKYANMVLTHSGCKSKTIEERKKRFQDKIYGKIDPDEPISIYLIDHFVDERYWFDYINSRKTA
jgi:hypothetical protein